MLFNAIYCTWQGYVTTTMIICTRPAQNQGSQNYGKNCVDGLQSPTLTEASLAADSC